MKRLLGISHYKQDTSYLVPVLLRCRDQWGWDVQILITGLDKGSTEAADPAKESDIEILPGPTQIDLNGVRNPFVRARQQQETNVALSREILQKARPSVIITTQDIAHHTFFPTATDLGVPSLYMQWTEVHSLGVHKAYWRAEDRAASRERSFPHRWKRRIARPIEYLAGFRKQWPMATETTLTALQGEFYRRMAVDAGVANDRLIVTGNPQCDEMFEAAAQREQSMLDVRRQLGLETDQPLIVHARDHAGRIDHLEPDEAWRSQKAILDVARTEAPSHAVVVKMHPKEGDDEERRIRDISSDAIIIRNEVPTGPLVAASSLLISSVSSMLLWAVGVDTPSISAFLWRGAEDLKMRRHWSGVEMTDNVDELRRAVRNNIHDQSHREQWKRRRAECRDDFLILDGKCTDRIAQVLNELTNGTTWKS